MRTQLQKWILIGCATISTLLAVALLVTSGLPQREQFTGELVSGEWVAPEINALAPPIIKTTLAGEDISLQNLQGYPVIINFWATWCVPCRVEMPMLQSFFERYHEQGLEVIAVNMGENQSTVQDWITDFGYTFMVILDEDQSLFERYQIRGQPSTFIVSPQGIITDIFYGPISDRGLNNALQPFLEESENRRG